MALDFSHQLTIALLVSINIHFAQFGNALTYGEACEPKGGEVASCSQESGLICNKEYNLCSCEYQSMVFRYKSGKGGCYATVGQFCGTQQRNGTQTKYECAENSLCDLKRHICICGLGYLQVAGRACTDPLANSGVDLPIICCKPEQISQLNRNRIKTNLK